MKSIVITGATSFIGVHFINECLAKNYKIYAVVRPQSINLSRIPISENIEVIQMEMSEYNLLPQKVDKADIFVHLAWEGTRAHLRDDDQIQYKNYNCALTAMNAAVLLGCQVFLGTGSQAEYGKMEDTVTELSPCNPITEYGKSKLLVFEHLSSIADENKIRFVWTRIFSIYGKYDFQNSLIMSALDKMINNEPIDLTACTQVWNYLHVKDAATAILTLVENEKAHGIYNVAGRDNKPLQSYIEEMKETINSSSELRFGVVPYNAEGIVNLKPDIAKIMALGWRPMINFDEGILDLME